MHIDKNAKFNYINKKSDYSNDDNKNDITQDKIDPSNNYYL